MLINTVVLFLHNALPIVIIIVLLLLSLKKAYHKRFLKPWLTTLFISILSTFFLVNYSDDIAQLFQGMALELLFSMVFVGVYLLIILYLYQIVFQMNKQRLNYIAMLIFFLVFTVNASAFFIYFTGFWSQTELQLPLLIGTLLGFGICLSIGILLYFILLFFQFKNQQGWTLLLLFLFSCGQLNQAVNLQLQIDFLPSFEALWDSTFLLNEDSELGYFFTALLGYEATPSILHLGIYLTALGIPLFGYFYLKNNKVVMKDRTIK